MLKQANWALKSILRFSQAQTKAEKDKRKLLIKKCEQEQKTELEDKESRKKFQS